MVLEFSFSLDFRLNSATNGEALTPWLDIQVLKGQPLLSHGSFLWWCWWSDHTGWRPGTEPEDAMGLCGEHAVSKEHALPTLEPQPFHG